MRDVALAVTILLNGQKPSQFGFEGMKVFGGNGEDNNYEYYSFSFTKEESRKATFDSVYKTRCVAAPALGARFHACHVCAVYLQWYALTTAPQRFASPTYASCLVIRRHSRTPA